MKCSIVIPYFQRKPLLFNTLKSLDKQIVQGHQFETIVIDDGSANLEHKEILNLQLGIEIHYYKFERSPKSCASFARNKGIEYSTGDILIFLDCDEIVDEHFVQNHIQFLEKAKAMNPKDEFFQIGLRRFLKNQIEWSVDDVMSIDYKPDDRLDVFAKFSYNLSSIRGNWHLGFSCNISVFKSTILNYGGFDENFKGWGLEDCEFSYRLVKSGVKMLYNPNIVAFHQPHEDNHDLNRYIGWRKNLDYFISKHLDFDVCSQLIFCDNYIPENRNNLENSGVEKVWLYCFERFEKTLQYFYNKRNNETDIYLANPSKEELELIMNNSSYNQYLISCDRKNIEAIIFVHCHKNTDKIKLYIN